MRCQTQASANHDQCWLNFALLQKDRQLRNDILRIFGVSHALFEVREVLRVSLYIRHHACGCHGGSESLVITTASPCLCLGKASFTRSRPLQVLWASVGLRPVGASLPTVANLGVGNHPGQATIHSKPPHHTSSTAVTS
jgi:hypothetical protein